MTSFAMQHRRQRLGQRLASAALLVAVGAGLGCSSLTDVDAPDVVGPDAVNNPAGANAKRLGAIGRFVTAFAGSGTTRLGQVLASGAITDELFSTVFSTIATEPDRRALLDPGSDSHYLYQIFQQAHVNALQAIQAMQQFLPAERANIGELFAIAGYTKVFFAENMCSGIPISPVVDGLPQFGVPLTTEELLVRAGEDFDSALSYGAESARVAHLARVGQGRALLARGLFAEAAAAVAPVPSDYRYLTEHSATVQPNNVFAQMTSSRWFTVADREGINGLNFRSAADPRVPTQLLGTGADGLTPVHAFTRYNSLASPVVLASGTEARLIQAEAQLQTDALAALATLNALRATTPGLAPLTLQATPAAQVDQLFRERAFWLFLTGHRHGDMRRLIWHYGRATESVFPTGMWKSGQLYDREVTFAPSVGEQPNPNYTACLDRNP